MVALLCCYVAICGFFGSKPTFWKPSQSFSTSWHAKSQVGAPKVRKWRAKSRLLARPLSSWRAPSPVVARASCPILPVCLVGSVGGHLARANLTVLAHQLDSFGAPSPDLTRQLRSWRAPACESARDKAREANFVTAKPTPDTVHSPTPGQLHVHVHGVHRQVHNGPSRTASTQCIGGGGERP